MEKFLPWHGNGELVECIYEVGVISYGTDGLFKFKLIALDKTKTDFEIIFEAPLAIRIVQEGSLMDYWNSEFMVKGHNIFIAAASQLLNWLEHSSSGAHLVADIKHIAVFTDDVCIEILSRDFPLVHKL
jgi:hypothetical protein